MKVEFLLAYEDKTWNIESFDVPDHYNSMFTSKEDLEEWWEENYLDKYKNVLLAVVYSMEYLG